jgi:hypothetical protein
MKQEPIITYSELTGHFYIVTRYKRLDEDSIQAITKFDITNDLIRLLPEIKEAKRKSKL